MRCMINCQEFDIPTREDGTIDVDAIKRAAGISQDRLVIRQGHDGRNEVLNPGGEASAQPGDRFMDAPIHKQGE
jgi:hypothetical protein